MPDVPRPYDRYYISVDYGTVNPTSMGALGPGLREMVSYAGVLL